MIKGLRLLFRLIEIAPLLLEIEHFQSSGIGDCSSWKCWQGCGSFVSIFSGDFSKLFVLISVRGLIFQYSSRRDSGVSASGGHVGKTFDLDTVQVELSLNINVTFLWKVDMFLSSWLY